MSTSSEAEPEGVRSASTAAVGAYNQVFETFVESDEDLEGLVAYALYKQHKRKWWLGHRTKHGRDPSAEEVRIFVDTVLSDQESYRLPAANSLLAFGQNYVEEATPDIERNAVAGRIETVALQVERSTGFWATVRSNVVGFLAVTVLLLAVAFFIDKAGIDLVDILGLRASSSVSP